MGLMWAQAPLGILLLTLACHVQGPALYRPALLNGFLISNPPWRPRGVVKRWKSFPNDSGQFHGRIVVSKVWLSPFGHARLRMLQITPPSGLGTLQKLHIRVSADFEKLQML